MRHYHSQLPKKSALDQLYVPDANAASFRVPAWAHLQTQSMELEGEQLRLKRSHLETDIRELDKRLQWNKKRLARCVLSNHGDEEEKWKEARITLTAPEPVDGGEQGGLLLAAAASSSSSSASSPTTMMMMRMIKEDAPVITTVLDHVGIC